MSHHLKFYFLRFGQDFPFVLEGAGHGGEQLLLGFLTLLVANAESAVSLCPSEPLHFYKTQPLGAHGKSREADITATRHWVGLGLPGDKEDIVGCVV